MGGEHGGQKVVLLHEYESIDGARPVGASGLCVGGAAHAVACVEGDVLPPSEFKFFFNEYIWLPGAIEQMVDRDDAAASRRAASCRCGSTHASCSGSRARRASSGLKSAGAAVTRHLTERDNAGGRGRAVRVGVVRVG